MSKKRLLRIWRSKALKRSLSTVTALVLFFGALPMLEISEELGDFSFSNAVVSAADEDHSEEDEPQEKFKQKAGKVVEIKPSELVEYSIAANRYHKYHQDDVLLINVSSSDSSGRDVSSMNFRPLGTEKYPFRGEVKVGALTGITLNIDGPLFDYVYDSAVINSGEYLKISRYYSSAASDAAKKTPIIANHVVHDADAEYTTSNPKPVWNFEIVPPSYNTGYKLQQFGGFIGKMWKDYSGAASDSHDCTGSADLTVNIEMNTSSQDSTNIPIKGTGDLGLACNTMGEGTNLDFTMESDRMITEISTSSGNVGGLVGSMEKGAAIKYTGPNMLDTDKEIKTTGANGYAGGVVGKNDGGNVTLPSGSAYAIKQAIQGTEGSGGIYGYYNPQATSAVTVDITTAKYDIDCKVKGNGSCGGLFGVLESDQKVTINTNTANVKSNHSAGGANAVYGGLIGTYKGGAAVNELIINGTANQTTVQTKNAGGSAFYGGGVGQLDPAKPTYVKFNNFTVNNAANANDLTFGGLVASADNAFVDADTVKVVVSDDGFKGGGLVGSLDHGVLRMKNTIDLSGAKAIAPGDSDDSTKFGQIVGYRDDAIIYAEKGWTFKRYSSGCEVDDIGGWGEVIRFDGQKITAVSQLFTVNETTHVLTVNKPSVAADSYKTIANEADFAKTALCMQIDALRPAEGDEEGTDNNYFIAFEDTTYKWDTLNSQNITLKSNIDLSGSGFTGLTRDNDVGGGKKLTYSGTITSSGTGAPYTVTLAVGEAYGDGITSHTRQGCGRIYRHLYNGLFGIISGAEINNVKFAGSIDVKADKDTMYVGAVAATATGSPTVNVVTVDTSFKYAGDKQLSLGGIIGEADSGVGDITVSNSTANCNITGSNSSKELYLGGAVGYINRTSDSSSTWSFSNVTVTGTISNSQGVDYNRMGGLVAAIAPVSGHSSVSRAMNLSSVNINGLAMSAAGGKTIGGALGYGWYDVNVDFNDVNVQKKGSTNTTITLSGSSGDTAGLVYSGTGHWTVNDAEDVEISGLTVTNTSARSFGGFVNKAWYMANKNNNYKGGNSSALYLELKSVGAFKIGTGVTFPSAGVYDEIAAYSAYYREDDNGRYYAPSGDSDNLYVLQNGAAVISIKTDVEPSSTPAKGLNMDNGTNASHSYVPQTTDGNKPNPYTRYYYNLDKLADDSSNASKLMRWGLRQYAHPSLTSCFSEPGTIFNSITAEYDMQGYSWYPVDVDESVTVKGIFKFYNKEFEVSEDKTFTVSGANGTHTYFRTSLYDSDKKSTTQHYLMQNGLFRNVNAGKTLTIGTITLQGNVGKAPYGSGALICGRVQGSQDNKATVNVTGTIELDRVYVHDISLGDSEYAPLAINKVGNYSNLSISAKTKVSLDSEWDDELEDFIDTKICYDTMTTSEYPGLKKDGDYTKAGTSLIGDVGLTSAPVGIILDFSNVILDGRTADIPNLNQEYDDVYGSRRSVFTKATLLNSFKYESGSFGKYNFTWEDDQKPSIVSGVRVYPHAVTYGKELGYRKTNSGASSEYPDKELWYSGQDHTNGKYTNPSVRSDKTGTYSDSFISGFLRYVYAGFNEGNKTHQLMVNQDASAFSGCGTYNDPYIINDGGQLASVSMVLNTNKKHTGFNLNIPLKSSTQPNFDATWHGEYADANYAYLGSQAATTTTDPTTGEEIEDTPYYPEGYYKNGVRVTVAKVNNEYVESDNYLTIKTVQKYLAGAYYKVGNVEKITIESDSGFLGLGYNGTDTTMSHAYFRGVFIGSNLEIINKTANPFIASSKGCVVKDLTVKVEYANNISVSGSTDTFDRNNGAYGGLIRRVFGGDNIIDNVLVDYSGFTKKIEVKGTSAQLAPVGGYIGVIVNGGVIFKNMTDRAAAVKSKGLTNGKVTATGLGSDISVAANNMLDDDKNCGWLYVNPIIGRVINGFAVNESGAYRPFEDGVREYGDGTKVYYTETKDSNGNVTASSFDGSESNKVGVTLKNGTKNYSITDISLGEGKLDTYYNNTDNNIGVPNAQAFFIMSLMVNSGIRSNVLGYSTTATNYNIKRWAAYTDVKTNTSQTTAPTTGDYSVAKSDNTSREGYLANAYTTDSSKIGNISGTITLTDEGGTYYLPDGYKGLGNVYQNDDNTRLLLSNFVGKGATISQNTTFNYYFKANGNKSDVFDSKYTPSSNVGLGLINCQNCDVNKFDDFTLSGNVKAEAIDQLTGDHVPYKGSLSKWEFEFGEGIDRNHMMSAGSLIGLVTGKSVKVENIRLLNVDVKGLKCSGGLIGLMTAGAFTLTNTKYDSEKIIVTGASNTGGLIGRKHDGSTSIDFGGKNFGIDKVICECEDRAVDDTYDANYGVGGLIGLARGNNNNVTIQNINIGTPDQTSSPIIRCDSAKIFTGGLVGIYNKAKITTKNCNLYNLDITSSYYAGGLTGHIATSQKQISEFSNINLYKNAGAATAQIDSTGNASGGFIGAGKHDISHNVQLTNCSISGYTIKSQHYSGGVAGVWGYVSDSTTKAANLVLSNFSIKSCTIASDDCSGGLVGLMNLKKQKAQSNNSTAQCLQGYNILAKNLDFEAYTQDATTPYKGYIAGYNEKKIQIAGYSRQEDRSGNQMLADLVGHCSSSGTNVYGSNGYVIFADYDDTASVTSPRKWFSNVVYNSNGTTCANVTTMRSVSTITKSNVEGSTTAYGPYDTNTSANTDAGHKTTKTSNGVNTTTVTVNENYPFVTNNPWQMIDTANILTGDAVGDGKTTFASSTFNKIYSEKSQAKGYKNTPTIATGQDSDWEYLREHYSTSTAEFIKQEEGVEEFPLLVVEDTDSTKVTNLINNYLDVLTNTKLNFADTTTNKGIYNLALRRMVYNNAASVKKFEDQTGTTDATKASLRCENSKFYMDASYVDTGTTPQFTLLDVQFYDPSTITWSGTTPTLTNAKVAYHLYVPVYVKKLLKYDFYASLASNSNYYKNAYKLENGFFKANTLFENLGNTVTLALEYNYTRTPDEWKDALNGGENVLVESNYYKSIYLKPMNKDKTGTSWPSVTRMVLVDSTKDGKNYYLNTPLENDNLLCFNTFHEDPNSSASDTDTYKPAPFNDLMTITTEPLPTGALVRLPDSSGATFRDKDGYYYKLKESGVTYPQDTSFYNVKTVTMKPERYYLTIFTKKPASTDADYSKVFYYEINSNDKFERTGTDGNQSIPSEYWRPNNIDHSDPHLYLLLGNLYENTYDLKVRSKTTDQLLSASNNYLDVTMTSTIKLTETAITSRAAEVIKGKEEEAGIYQTFLMTYDMLEAVGGESKIGIDRSAVSLMGGKYDILPDIIAANDFTPTADSSILKPDDETADETKYAQFLLENDNYLEMRNNQNLIPYLSDSTKHYAVTMQAKISLLYNDKTLPRQFPKATTNDIGTCVIGYSNISSSVEDAAYSATSEKQTDAKRYHIENSAAAKLIYNMVEKTTVDTTDMTEAQAAQAQQELEKEKADGKYRSLGINAKTDEQGFILSRAEYDTSVLTTSNDYDYVELTLTLSDKDNYVHPTAGNPVGDGTARKISDYLTGLKIYGKNKSVIFDQSTAGTGADAANVKTTVNTDGTVYTVRVKKDLIETRGEITDGRFIFQLEYGVKTGDGTNSWNKKYSNYKVSMTAELCKELDPEGTDDKLTTSFAYDHIIYTNAKIEPSVITVE